MADSYFNGEHRARKSYDDTWFVEKQKGKGTITVASKLNEDEAKNYVNNYGKTGFRGAGAMKNNED